MRFETKEKALQYCMDLITPDNITDKKDYAILRQYKVRFNKDKDNGLKERATQRIFDYFGIKQHCYYTLENTKTE